MTDDLGSIVERALALDKWAISRLVTIFEDQRVGAAARRLEILGAIDAARAAAGRVVPGAVLGITGTPGSGKSTLLSKLAGSLLRRSDSLRIAILAVDPSSEVSGGALLGDRTRMRLPVDDPRAFFRSQASANDLGGLGPSSFQVTTVLSRFFDIVFVETVGIGQSEADVRHLAERVYLVLQPLGGDEVQFLKAGIIEHPDVFVLNKSDQPTAAAMFHQLHGSLWLARPFDDTSPPVLRVSALTGAGMDELEADVIAAAERGGPTDSTHAAAYFFRRWVTEEWGRAGDRFVEQTLGGADAYVAECGGYDAAVIDLASRLGDLAPGATPRA